MHKHISKYAPYDISKYLTDSRKSYESIFRPRKASRSLLKDDISRQKLSQSYIISIDDETTSS
jgi:hypothetical protein